MGRNRGGVVVAAALAVGAAGLWSCGEPDPKVPGGTEGTDPRQWFVFDVGLPDRDPRDIVMRFTESARVFGCTVDRLGQQPWRRHTGVRLYTGVEARCDEGVIRMAPLQAGVRVACAEPTSEAKCNGLLREISDAR